MPYRHLFDKGYVSAYDGADIEAQGNVNLSVGLDAGNGDILVNDESYDIVVHFQVMEHIPNPSKFLLECYRVLRPGGTLFCSVPFLFEYHAVPGDYHRWTHQGLQYDLEAVGFQNIQVEPIESDWESVITIIELFAARKIGYVLGKPFFLAANLLSWIPSRNTPALSPLTIAAWAKKSI
jgi:SAM-dependent methyltransferase